MTKPRYTSRHGWTGGDSRTLYAFTDARSGDVTVRPGGSATGIGPACSVAIATRAQAESLWQSPLHSGWRVA